MLSLKQSKKMTTLVAIISVFALLLVGCAGQAGAPGEPGEIDEWTFATNHEFSVRPDGLPELVQVYDFEFDNVEVMDLGITYGALQENRVSAAMGFGTDGRIAAFDLVNLVDDKNFFPVYNPAPVVRTDVIEQYPELEELMQPVSEALDTDTMIELNRAVDVDDKDVTQVAVDWLNSEGILTGEQVENAGEISVGSKEFTEQLLLGAITIAVLEDAGFDVEDNTNLSGSVVVRESLLNGDVDIYWEYTGTAWLTYLEHEEAITDPVECYEAVKQEDLEKNDLVWLDYAPFNNTYTIMMRQADADALGIESISDLAELINQRQ
ncbi:ABC transporter, substrate-binding protein (cluster 13, osmolytes) [Candidatus Syntrophocurvum alkaliphilum]|uniref:ABC transporter, substrate-binding protein (Cluster 13, osmolytes) n=1 Tax=Candidatus Syntrophocurvum alkaliphilum TaxID=2293317 RepID=A0A6I6DJN2_9FIRM|nr:glycine betaine ABC transporter substrate-binding protein [Candidatus Syntrophocurvum alkaliphilum]QGT99934.1 ABC transporter, substrate-binding protein (cluster 13, osmolytes) [Candidatus Syntrophocurvum alkaliphilum]